MMHRLPPSRRPPRGGRCPETGPQRATGPLGGPAAGGPNDGVDGDTGMVGSRTPGRAHLHGGGQPAVVSHGQGKLRPWHAAWIPRLTDLLVHTTILPPSLVPVLNTRTRPISLNLMHCRGHRTARANQHGRCPPPAHSPQRALEGPCRCQPHGARVPSFAPHDPLISN